VGILSELLCAALCDTMFTVRSSYTSNTLNLSHLDPYAV